MAKLSPAALLSLLTERAPALREAGVTALSFGDVSVQLAPHVPPPSTKQGRQDDQRSDLLSDPASYGLPEEATLPGFTRPNREGT